jgi:diadenosine tetraphosphate (Ap4A) HIT family hydrolase
MSGNEIVLKKYTHWTTVLHKNQYYLGRCYIVSHRQGLVDLMDLTPEERDELFTQAGPELKSALEDLFTPGLFNWASLGNIVRQCHVHCIPRYESERTFMGDTFVDAEWGRLYNPDGRHPLTEAQLAELQRQIVMRMS